MKINIKDEAGMRGLLVQGVPRCRLNVDSEGFKEQKTTNF